MPDLPEEMDAFFNARADGYDEHMREVLDAPAFYGAIAAAIQPTSDPIAILDLGIGTGLELEGIFAHAPHAQITGIDLAIQMLDLLRAKYAAHLAQITLWQDSYLTWSFPPAAFDYVVSAQSLHHLLPGPKCQLYQRIFAALKPYGTYIEGDYIVTQTEELRLQTEYETQHATSAAGQYHIDLPCSVNTQRALLLEAGFETVEVTYETINCGIMIGRKR
jgi:tRNA (cmo5U34)-methyltransferase